MKWDEQEQVKKLIITSFFGFEPGLDLTMFNQQPKNTLWGPFTMELCWWWLLNKKIHLLQARKEGTILPLYETGFRSNQ